jgi:hypothetical protein
LIINELVFGCILYIRLREYYAINEYCHIFVFNTKSRTYEYNNL